MSLKTEFIQYINTCLIDGLKIDDDNRKPMSEIFELLEADRLGVIITGKAGSGKSMVFEALRQVINPSDKKHFKLITAREIVQEYNVIGDVCFDGLKQPKNIVVDDLGIEQYGKYYGKECNVLEDFIHVRYEVYKRSGHKTHFTTNLTSAEIHEKYGARAFSRLGELCQMVVLGGDAKHKDRRAYRNFIKWQPIFHEVQLSKEDIEFRERYRAMEEQRKAMSFEDARIEAKREQRREYGFTPELEAYRKAYFQATDKSESETEVNKEPIVEETDPFYMIDHFAVRS